MGITTVVRELMEAVNFVCSLQFWRMAVSWTISLVASYFQLFSRRLFDGGSCRYSHCVPPRIGSNSNRPICIITGATSGLGAAAAHALSRKGFCVVLGICLLYLRTKKIPLSTCKFK
uniref:Dehydrogenase/reductase SDR family member on chromosome X homolog isoform X2 n=1 Tax=Rhizophora mucronata TaxID=61149 RepID=A0A2P2KR81_RHIMU